MRVWGREYNQDGTYDWVKITTDANGYNDEVYLTALCQDLKLQPGESPFYANYGIPAQPSVMTQVFPDFYVHQAQQQYSQYFASLKMTNINAVDEHGQPVPAYRIDALTNSGAIITQTVAQ